MNTTGHARVVSTFGYLSGFADFGILAPSLLLSLGIEARRTLVRYATLAAAGVVAIQRRHGGLALRCDPLYRCGAHGGHGLGLHPHPERAAMAVTIAAV